MFRRSTLAAVFCTLLIANVAAAEGPKVHLVVGAKADAIEKFAAEEMAGQLKKLFEADVAIVAAAPNDATNVIHLGTKDSSPLAAKFGDGWPKLSDQGHALKSLDVDGKKALLVAGGSPRAVLWCAYELGWQYGIRYFSFGDLFPTAPTFTLAGFDVLLEPRVPSRVWMPDFDDPIGPACWGWEEHRFVLRQAAKLKYTEVVCSLEPTSPLFTLARRIAVDGDTVGRSAFQGAKFFENPDLTKAATDDERVKIAAKLADNFIVEAGRLGFVTSREKTSFAPGFGIGSFNTGLLPIMSPYRPNGYSFTVGGRGSFENQDPFVQKYYEQLYETVFDPICGEGVAARVREAFKLTTQRAQHETKFKILGPNPNDFTIAYGSTEPPPAWWGEVRTHYLNAMNEMYRANTRAREGGRAFTLYYARRFEFAFEYMNVVEALRKAAIAKKAGDKDAQIAELEKALDSITNACNAMAAVARSNSDRGIIAVMNEYGYRPVTKLLEEADAN